MDERSKVEDFLDAYRAAFEAFDGLAIADLFFYPCQITSDAGEIAVTTVPSREAWLPQIERLLAAYRALGVRSAKVSDLQVIEFTPQLTQAVVRWSLVGREGERIYDFDASYTLADLGQSTRITAIAHNEAPRLRASLERQRFRCTTSRRRIARHRKGPVSRASRRRLRCRLDDVQALLACPS